MDLKWTTLEDRRGIISYVCDEYKIHRTVVIAVRGGFMNRYTAYYQDQRISGARVKLLEAVRMCEKHKKNYN